MHTQYPSNDFGSSSIYKRLLIAFGSAGVLALIAMAWLIDNPTLPAALPTPASQIVEHQAIAPRPAELSPRIPISALTMDSAFGASAQEQLRLDIKKSISMSMANLLNDLM